MNRLKSIVIAEVLTLASVVVFGSKSESEKYIKKGEIIDFGRTNFLGLTSDDGCALTSICNRVEIPVIVRDANGNVITTNYFDMTEVYKAHESLLRESRFIWGGKF